MLQLRKKINAQIWLGACVTHFLLDVLKYIFVEKQLTGEAREVTLIVRKQT